jgi:hypothetical protein
MKDNLHMSGLSETIKKLGKEKAEDALLNPPKENQDVSCPKAQLMFEDLAHTGGYGAEWKCKLQGHTELNDQYGGTAKDYKACNCKNHEECPAYQSFLKTKQ